MSDKNPDVEPSRPSKRARSEEMPDAPEKEKHTTSAEAEASDSDSDSDDDFGPAMPSSEPARKKKRRVLPHEKLYLKALPASNRYSKSLMHRDAVSFVWFTPVTEFLITASVDGIVKFWKKMAKGIEFVKMFRAHKAPIVAGSVSVDGRSFATVGGDKWVKIFDVVTFDLLAQYELPHVPKTVCWVHKKGASLPLLAISDAVNPHISIYDGRGENPKPIHILTNLHRKLVHIIVYNDKYDCCISADESGMVEYWRPNGDYSKPSTVFEMKSATNLFEFKKAKSVPVSITISPTQESFATFSQPDRQVRIFDFPSGKLHRAYDESITTLTTRQQAADEDHKMDPIQFGKRIAIEKDIDARTLPGTNSEASADDTTVVPTGVTNVIFDETGYFILYGSLAGIKVVNTVTNKLVRTIAAEEQIRPTNLAIYQGAPKRKDVMTVEMAASSNPLLEEATRLDPIVVTTAWSNNRFYMFTNETDISKDRDIINEKPQETNQATSKDSKSKTTDSLPTHCILHTTLGDIHLRLFPQHTPRTVQNFTTHARSGYYNNVLFHRVIKKFMIQTGDPLGDGTGGESIWGGTFEDEFWEGGKHDRPYVVSMANAGPNTNGSQFFITTERAEWLDGKHTVFGRAVRGLEVVKAIEAVRVDRRDRPEEDIRIVSITVL